jgi:CubicO group peptidase (beta-lactamase class C family)
MTPTRLRAAGAALLIACGSAFAQVPPPAQPVAPAPAAEQTQAGHDLNAADVNGWLDGFMPLALTQGDIAGAVVVVVKDGQVLTQRGFGVSDVATQAPVLPDQTLFRIGSVSKLFTWTAVMQLVEAGKLNLDADINTYLDFNIPPRDGKPISLRNLMTHTGGFEEHAKHLMVPGASDMTSLREYLSSWIPDRIFPPGVVPAYSNYGATLAGYIVQRVSGESFDAYIDGHIYKPLGMTSSSFSQPLPPALALRVSKSYYQATGPANPFEFVQPWPAGSMSTTGVDMAHFMMAHLNDGQFGTAQILQPATAELMHRQAFAATPPLPGMALGFYHEDRNGHDIIGHAGDTSTFHSDLHLFLNDNTGLFVSFNSLGTQGAAHTMRTLLFDSFTDRYFPAPHADKPTLPTAKSHAALIAGTYISSRRSDTSFLHLIYMLGATKVTADADGTLTLSDQKAPGGALEKWRETAPFVWQKLHGVQRIAAVVGNGTVKSFGIEGAPFEIFQPATATYAGWNAILADLAGAILACAAVLWPVTALVRRHYGQRFGLTGLSAIFYRLVRIVAVADIAVAIGWVTLLSLVDKNITLLNDVIDPWLRLLQALGIIGIAGGLIGVLNAVVVWARRDASWWAKLSSTLIALATVGVAWLIIGQRLVTVSLEF